MSDQYQTVTLVLGDGRRVHYTGRAQIDHINPPRVVEVIVGTSRPLPDGMTWDQMPEPTERTKPMSLTDEWLECYDDAVTAGKDLGASIFWRLAVECLPVGVDGSDPRVVAAVANIKRQVEAPE